MAAGTKAAMLRMAHSNASSAMAFSSVTWPPTRRKAMKVPPPAAIQADQMQRRRRGQARAGIVKRFDGGAERYAFLDFRKKPPGNAFGKARAALLQENQQRDARHRQQQHHDHRLGQRAAALQWRNWVKPSPRPKARNTAWAMASVVASAATEAAA